MTPVVAPVATPVPVDIRRGASKSYPPGPNFLPRLLSGQFFRGVPTTNMTDAPRQFGDLLHSTAFGRHIYQISHPSLIEDYFLKDSSRHHRGIVMQHAKIVCGEGLLTSEEPVHMRQRRLAQPAFLRQRIAAYGEVIGRNATDVSSRWQSGKTIDLHVEMLELALWIVGKCLFDLDVRIRAQLMQVSTAVDVFMGILPILPFSGLIQRLPIPRMRRIRKGKADLDRMIYSMIEERRKSPGDRGDLLSMLMESTDVEADDTGMSDQQVLDECMTIMLAGHETTANALSFSLWLLAKHQDIQQRLHEEAYSVLGSRIPTAADYGNLPYTTSVFSETLRLYPPVWATARTCAIPYEIACYIIPKGSVILAPQFVVHRDPRFYAAPLHFDPNRFSAQNKESNKSRPRFAFYPFAAGSRQCIGEGLAWMEGVLSLAAIARDFRLTLPHGAPSDIELDPAISLRPKHGVPLVVERL
jgi:cytochrome P450